MGDNTDRDTITITRVSDRGGPYGVFQLNTPQLLLLAVGVSSLYALVFVHDKVKY